MHVNLKDMQQNFVDMQLAHVILQLISLYTYVKDNYIDMQHNY